MTTTGQVRSTDLKNRIPELDGLRGLAIGMVIIWHYFTFAVKTTPGTVLSYLFASTRLTWSGVDLFFVLSGFLIGGILLDARNATNYFQVFYTRRFFRIVPIYAAVLLVFPLLSLLQNSINPGVELANTGSSPPWYMYWIFMQNLWMAAASNLGNNNLRMTWSLAVEEQFYLALPLVVFLVPRRLLKWIIVSGIVIAPLLRIAIHLHWPDNWGAAFVLMPCRADALLLGVLATILLREDTWRERIQNSKILFAIAFPLLLLGIAYLGLRSHSLTSSLMITVGYSWLAFFYVSVLVYAVVWPESLLGRVLSVRWLRWLGSIAYGTYLLHQAVLSFLFSASSVDPPIITGAYSLLLTLMALVLTLVIARLSWEYFEKRLVKLGYRTGYMLPETSPRLKGSGREYHPPRWVVWKPAETTTIH